MSNDTSRTNVFTHGALVPTLVKTALPIILVMATNGLLTVADAAFLGHYVGPDALSAVTLMFPAYMLLVAGATLVSTGMSSILARHLGAMNSDAARSVFSGAHGLSLLAGALVILLFWTTGYRAILIAAGGSEPIAQMAFTYLAITASTSPLLFVLSVQTDALRSEGYVAQMAGMSLLVSLANILFNFVLVGLLKWGVAGSAMGTALAQVVTFTAVILFRMRAQTILKPSVLFTYPLNRHWRPIIALGAPQSLNFAGIGFASAATIAALQHVGSDSYDATIAAFGIITRVMTFVFLPLLGLTQALQAMIGNNYGAKEWRRSDDTLRLGLLTALIYCIGAQALLSFLASPVGYLFVDDMRVVDEIARIMPINIALMFAAGPLFVIAAYFQACGDAKKAAVISLVKPYLFFLPLLIVLPYFFGETGIWLTGPVAELLLLILTALMLFRASKKQTARWGLFLAPS
ncbi:MATE family efflux transporter [uncultured Roseibium sp.]|uniref:MATE family efflux transporter n=1 Tax=uncultured Roseibium sp. TaxID=1936171 RepID=UPI002617072D|nr:MATE family efflux transporter [uncultured Roseibium sp.]